MSWRAFELTMAVLIGVAFVSILCTGIAHNDYGDMKAGLIGCIVAILFITTDEE